MLPNDPATRPSPRVEGRDEALLGPIGDLISDLDSIRVDPGDHGGPGLPFEVWEDGETIYIEATRSDSAWMNADVDITIYRGKLFVRMSR